MRALGKGSIPREASQYFGWLPAALVASALVGFYMPLVRGQQVYRHLTWRVVVPCRAFLGEQLRSGKFPVWYPYEQLGTPFHAQAICGALHPFSWMSALLRAERVVSIQVLCLTALAAVGAWCLSRVLGSTPWGCAIAAVSYALSGYLVLSSGNLVYLSSASHLPLQLAFFASAGLRGWSRGSFAGAVITNVSSILMGDIQLACFFAAVAALMGLGLCSRLVWRSYLVGGGLAACLTAGLAAPQLLPSLLFFRQTSRAGSGLPWEAATHWSLHPLRIPELLLPAFSPIGAGGRGGHLLGLASAGDYWAQALGGSSMVTLLAVGALVSSRVSRRVRVVFGLLAAVGLLLALGRFTPIYRLAYNFLPGVRSFRFPEKFVPLCLCALSALAALGWSAADRKWWRAAATASLIALALALLAQQWRLIDPYQADYLRDLSRSLVFAGTDFLVAALLLRFGGVLARVGVLVLVGAEVIVGSIQAYDTRPLSDSQAKPESIAVLRQLGVTPGAGRITHMGFAYPLNESQYFTTEERQWMDVERSAAVADIAGWLGVESIDQYLPGTDPAYSAAHDHPTDQWLLRIAPRLNVRVAVVSPQSRKDFPEIGEFVSRIAGGSNLLRLPDPWPRAFLAAGVAPDPSASVFDQLGGLERGLVLIEGWKGAASSPGGNARITLYEPDDVRVRVDANRPGFFVLNDLFAPGWTALLDGRRVRIWRANGLVRAVSVPAGQHAIEFLYRAPGLRLGLAFFALSFVLLVVTVIAFPRGTRPRGARESTRKE